MRPPKLPTGSRPPLRIRPARDVLRIHALLAEILLALLCLTSPRYPIAAFGRRRATTRTPNRS